MALQGLRRALLPAAGPSSEEIVGTRELLEGTLFLKPGSMSASILTLSCINMGVGVFALPARLAQVGLARGVMLIFASAFFSNAAQLMMCQLTNRLRVESLEEICFIAMGRVGRAAASLFLVITCTIVNCAHLLVVSDIGRGLVQYWMTGKNDDEDAAWQYSQAGRAMVIASLGLLVMPFCWTKFINSLRFVSTLSFFWIICLCMVCTAFSIRESAELGVQNLGTTLPSNTKVALDRLIKASGDTGFLFGGMLAFFHVRSESNRKQAMSMNVIISTGLCTFFYITVALFGAMAFSQPADMYLDQFPRSNLVIQVGCAGVCMVLTLLYPIVNFPLVRALDKLFFPEPAPDRPSIVRMRMYSIPVLAVVVAIDCALPCSSDVIGVGGGLGLGMLNFGLPALCYMMLSTKAFTRNGQVLQRERNIPFTILALIILIYGTFLTVGMTYVIVNDFIRNPGQC